jgi:DNA-directed RNA polymerase specialized sigma24 family protein
LVGLTPVEREIFEARYVSELSQRAAARVLGVSYQRLRSLELQLYRSVRAGLQPSFGGHPHQTSK